MLAKVSYKPYTPSLSSKNEYKSSVNFKATVPVPNHEHSAFIALAAYFKSRAAVPLVNALKKISG